MCTSSVSNVIYHTFSHGAAFYTLSGKSVNVMLELWLSIKVCGYFSFSDAVILQRETAFATPKEITSRND